MTKKEKRKLGCLPIFLAIVAGLLILYFLSSWRSTRPKTLLKNSLGIEYSERINRLEAEYIGGLDYTVHLYLEADPEVIERILSGNDFEKVNYDENADSHRREGMNFPAAPPLPNGALLLYEKHIPTVIRYIIVTPDRSRLWYAAFDY
ncbi:hypothetical protein [Coraliomargarita parva]|uniref:hypothetical protein n=1 Tax=Coraliomargarita parva TaxID=3014050 RepID=UPI0022B438BB|nr:hypothetical protein [Coraliomargarita parva]